MKGLLIGAAVAAGVIGVAIWAQAQTDNSIDSRDLLLNDWGVSIGITVMVPKNRAATAIAWNNKPSVNLQLVDVIGSSNNTQYLLYFPSTDTLHVNADGYPLDAIATASWKAYAANKRAGVPVNPTVREAGLAPTINWVPPPGTFV